jgi:hypothetical protein
MHRLYVALDAAFTLRLRSRAPKPSQPRGIRTRRARGLEGLCWQHGRRMHARGFKTSRVRWTCVERKQYGLCISIDLPVSAASSLQST